MSIPVFAKLIAKSPPAILLVLGGIGWLTGMHGAGILLFLGVALQILWLIR